MEKEIVDKKLIESLEKFTEFVNKMELRKTYYFPSDFFLAYAEICCNDAVKEYYWYARHCNGIDYSMPFGSKWNTYRTFKTISGSKRSMVKAFEYRFKQNTQWIK